MTTTRYRARSGHPVTRSRRYEPFVRFALDRDQLSSTTIINNYVFILFLGIRTVGPLIACIPDQSGPPLLRLGAIVNLVPINCSGRRLCRASILLGLPTYKPSCCLNNYGNRPKEDEFGRGTWVITIF